MSERYTLSAELRPSLQRLAGENSRFLISRRTSADSLFSSIVQRTHLPLRPMVCLLHRNLPQPVLQCAIARPRLFPHPHHVAHSQLHSRHVP